MAVYLDRIADQGLPDDLSSMDDSVTLIWMTADERIFYVAREGWHEARADYAAEGSGREVAMGAMAMGASAEQAAKIASDLIVDCGGEIHVLRLETTP